MLNMITRCLIGFTALSASSAGHAESKPEKETKVEAPEAETTDDQAPGEIVFVPHDFGVPEVTEAGGVRGVPKAKITLLVPQQLSKALSPTPTFYWHVGGAIDELRFTLIEENKIEPLLEVSLDPADEPGVHSLALGAHEISLEEAGLYRWSIAANSEQAPIVAETVAQTVFQYDGNLETAPSEASPARLSTFLAENGYWYDLLDLVTRQSEAADANRNDWQVLQADLLEQIGLVLKP